MNEPSEPGWYRLAKGPRFWDGKSWFAHRADDPVPEGELPSWPPGDATPQNPGMTASASWPASRSDADELVKLAALHAAGDLTDDEFAAEKAKLLRGTGVGNTVGDFVSSSRRSLVDVGNALEGFVSSTMANPDNPGWYIHKNGERYWDGRSWKVTASVAKPDDKIPVWPPGSAQNRFLKPVDSKIRSGINNGLAIAVTGGVIGGFVSETDLGPGIAIIAVGAFLSTIEIVPALIARGVSLGLRHHQEFLDT